MNADTVKSLFTLFSGETDTEKYNPLILSAINETKNCLKPTASENDSRLDYLCAAITNFRYTQITSAKNKTAYTYGGTASMEGNTAYEYNFAKSLLDEYLKCAADLIEDKLFTFCGV